MNPGKHQSSKRRGRDLGWKVREGAHLLFFTYTLYMNYVIAKFLLVSCIRTHNLLLYFARFVHSQRQKQRTKTYNKELCRVS